MEQEEVKKLKVELTAPEWDMVLSVIEQSTGSYIHVKSITTELLKQLKPQVDE